MTIEIPSGSKSMTLPNGMEVQIPDGAKTMDVPDELFKTQEPTTQQVPQAQNPIAQQQQPQETKTSTAATTTEQPKKEYGLLEKVWDVATNSPVANFIPTKLKEWWDDDKTIKHDSKIDNDFRHNVSALSNPSDPTLTGMVGEWIGSEKLKEAGKRTFTQKDVDDYRDNVLKVAGEKYDVRFDEKTNDAYTRLKGTDGEFEKVLNDIGDASWDELGTRMRANLAQVGTEVGLDIGAGVAFDRKYGKYIKHPALRFVADGLVATVVTAPASSAVGSVAQTAYSGEEISTKRLMEKSKEEALDNTLATAAAMTGIGVLSLGARAAAKANPFHSVKGGKDDYKEQGLYEVPAKPDYIKAEDISANPITTVKNMESRYRTESKKRDDTLALIAKQKAEAEDIYKDFGGVSEQTEIVEMAGQSNTKEILGNHFNHSQKRVNAEVQNSLQLTQNFKKKFGLNDKTSADFYRFMRGGMQRVKDFYSSYYAQAQDLLLEEMGDDVVKVSSQTQSKLNELISEAKHPLNVENTRLSEAQKNEFNKDYQDLLEMTKRDFTEDVPVWNEKKEAFEYVQKDTKSYTVNGLFDVQKKFNAFLYKHKDKFTKLQMDELDKVKEAIYVDVYRAIETKDLPSDVKLNLQDLWSDANKGYSNYKELIRRSDVLGKLVEDDVAFDVAKFASDVFKNINKRDAGDFDILYTFGKELKKTGGNLDEFYSSIIDGMLVGTRDIKAPTGEVSQGAMRTIKHQNQSLEIMDFDAFHKAFNSIDETTLKKIFGLSPRGEQVLSSLKKFDDLASRESVLQQTLLNKEFKMSETAMQQHDQGKLMYSTNYGIKAMLWDSWAKYVMKNKAYEDFLLKAITKPRYEDIEPLLKKLDYDQREVPPLQRVDIEALRADLKAANEIAQQTMQKLKEVETTTGKPSTPQQVEEVTISGLLEYKATRDPSVRDFEIERLHAKELAKSEGMGEDRIARVNNFDDLGREIKDFKLERNEITMAHRRNPPPKGSEDAYKAMDEVLSANTQEKKSVEQIHDDMSVENVVQGEEELDLISKARADSSATPRDVERTLKVPVVKIEKWLKPNQISASGMYSQKEQSLKNMKSNTDVEIKFSDVDFNKYYKLANGMMPTFQGAKKEMGTIVPQIVKSIFNPQELKQIDTIKDYFGGGGSWGLFMAKTELLPNIKYIDIYEYSPARKQKIEFTHSHYKEIISYFQSDEAYKLMKYILDTEQQAGNVGSGYGIQKQIIEDLLKNAKNYDEVKQSALIALADYTTLSRGRKADPSQALKQMVEQLHGIGKAVDELKAKDVQIRYYQADSYALDHQAGSNILTMMDPPYLKTAGYSWVDIESGKLVKADTAVGMDIYTKTWQMINSLKEKGNSIIYTDEAYYKKSLYENYVNEDKVISEHGKNGYDMTIDIANKSDLFMEFPVDKRTETLSVIKSNKFKKEVDNGTDTRTEKMDNPSSNNGTNQVERSRDSNDEARGEYSELDDGAAQESSSTDKPDARVDADEPKQLEPKQEIDYGLKAQELNQNPPDLIELKALDKLAGNINFTHQVFMALRQSASGKPNQMNEYGAKLYQEAIEKYGDVLQREMEKIQYPPTPDNLKRLDILRGYFRYMKDSGQIEDGFASVVNPQAFKAMMEDLKSGKSIFRNAEYEDMYYDLQKLYEELAPQIEPLYHTKPKNTKPYTADER